MNNRRFKLSSLKLISVFTLPMFAACSDGSAGGGTGGITQGSGGATSSTSGGQGVLTSGGAATFGGAVSTSGGATTTSGGAATFGGASVGQGGSSSGGATTTSGGASSGGQATSGGSSTAGQSNSGGSSSGGSSSGGASKGGATGSGGTTGGSGGTSGDAKGGSSSGGASKGGATGSGGATGGSGGGTGSCDVLATVGQYKSKTDEELAELFDDYFNGELGTTTCATSAPAGTSRTITQTIFVPPGVTYDGKGETLKADATAMKCDLTAGESGESQRPYFLLAPGANVKNVTIAYPGCDGIHMMGNNVLDKIAWPDVGEDAASVRSYFPGGKITISNSNGHKAGDKMFQFNAPCDVRIENFTGSDMGKLVRQNGDTTFELHVDLNTVNVTGVVSAVVQSDSTTCFVRHHALTYQFTGSGDKSDRVFRDIPPANVTQY